MSDDEKDEKTTTLKLPDGELVLGHTRIPLEDLPKTLEGPKPEPRLIASIRRFGVLLPIVVAQRAGDRWEMIDGRRRLAAAREVYPDHHRVEALVLSQDSDTPDMRRVLTSIFNDLRSENPVTTFKAIVALTRRGASEREIYEATGLRAQELRRIVTLRELVPDAMKALSQGYMGKGVAFELAKLPNAVQQQIMDETTGRVSAKDVQHFKEARTQSALAELPFDMGGGETAPAFDWRKAVDERMQQVTKLVPDDEPELVEAIGKVFDLLHEHAVRQVAG